MSVKKCKNTELEHTTPESVGIKSEKIRLFVEEINKRKLNLHSFTIVRHNKIAAQCFFKPYSAEYPHILFSVSKSYTSTAVGIAISKGLLTVDDKVCDFFPEYNITKHKYNSQLTVRHLLTMHSGKHISFFTPRANHDWIQDYFDAPFDTKPGERFEYVSENTFMCSAIVSKVTGMSCLDFLYENLFAPLGIEKPFWEHDGKNNNAGGWGLYLKSTDIAKSFLPYLNGGKWLDGTQLIPEFWTREATRKQEDSVHDGFYHDGKCDNINGYGYQFWINPDKKSFRAEGLYGQRCMMFPEKDALIVLNSGQSKDYEIMDVFWKYFPSAFKDETLEENPKEYSLMKSSFKNCFADEVVATQRNTELENRINNKLIFCKSGENTSFLPIMLNLLAYNKPGKIDIIKLNFSKSEVKFIWTEKDVENYIVAGMDGKQRKSKIHLGDFYFDVFSSAYWDKNKLVLTMRPIQTCNCRILEFEFFKDIVNIKNNEDPDFQELVIFFLSFTGRPIKKNLIEKEVTRVIKNMGIPLFEPDFIGRIKE